MLPDFGHGVAHIRVGVEEMMVLVGLPVGESGEFLRDGLEETYNDTDRRGLHVIAELLDRSSVLLQ
jgi:hypothetical protein